MNGSPDWHTLAHAFCLHAHFTAARCEPTRSMETCKRVCDSRVGDTAPECVTLATAAEACNVDRGYVCADGIITSVSPDPCATEKQASEVCRRKTLRCVGADENGLCPPVHCSCYGQNYSYDQPQITGTINGTICECPDVGDCQRNLCPF